MHVGMSAFFQNRIEGMSDREVDYVERTDSGGLITMFSYGGMPHDMAKANMRLFAEKVLPRLKARACGVEIGGGGPLHVAAE